MRAETPGHLEQSTGRSFMFSTFLFHFSLLLALNMLVSFSLLWKPKIIKFKRGNVCFGSQLGNSLSIGNKLLSINDSCCSEPMAKSHIKVVFSTEIPLIPLSGMPSMKERKGGPSTSLVMVLILRFLTHGPWQGVYPNYMAIFQIDDWL